MEYNTSELCDIYADLIDVVEPIFCNYGGRSSFGGKVVTVKCFESNGVIEQVVRDHGEGKVLVIDGGGSTRRALIDLNIATIAANNSWEGIVCFGSVRDVDALEEIDMGIQSLVSIPVGALTYLDDKRGVNKASGLTDEERKKSRASRDKSKGEGRGKREGKGRNRKGNNAKGPTSFDGLKPRRASVQREVSKGIYETVEVKVGVTSRISAEVISGLGEGDRVVSGIIQYNAAGDTKEDRRNNKRIPRGF
jgi:regulator of ribonuclease activity A